MEHKFNSLNQNIEKSYMAFFPEEYINNNSKEVNVIFPDCVENKNFNNFSSELKEKRNYMVFICAFQVIASIMGMLYVIYRRSFIYLFINFSILGLAICGGIGSLKMNYLYIFVHCIFTISIPGAFFFYQIIDFLVAKEHENKNDKQVSEAIIFLIFSLPYLYDIAAGTFCYFFIKSISINLKENNVKYQRLKENFLCMKKKYSKEEIENHMKNIEEHICVICMNKGRETALTPCGHYLSCEDCTKRIFDRFTFTKPKCPICRKEINSFVKIIVS